MLNQRNPKMPAISFSTMKDKILNGEKKQTIRPLRTNYWLKFKKGDSLVGYWKMRTSECEKLFESMLSEDPFIIDLSDFSDELMIRDGFSSLKEALQKWFSVKYLNLVYMDFVVLRWK